MAEKKLKNKSKLQTPLRDLFCDNLISCNRFLIIIMANDEKTFIVACKSNYTQCTYLFLFYMNMFIFHLIVGFLAKNLVILNLC